MRVNNIKCDIRRIYIMVTTLTYKADLPRSRKIKGDDNGDHRGELRQQIHPCQRRLGLNASELAPL